MNAGDVPEIVTGPIAPKVGDVTPEASTMAGIIKTRAEAAADHLRRGVPIMAGDPVGKVVGALIALDTALNDVADTARKRAVDEPVSEAADVGCTVEAVSGYDTYLGILRGGETTTKVEMVATALPTFIQVVARLEKEYLNADAKATIIRFIGNYVGEISDPVVPAVALKREILTKSVPTEVNALNRWLLGHRVYGVANRSAAEHLDAAAVAYLNGEPVEVVNRLVTADQAVATITATMLYAAEMTSLEYNTEVRPTMHPPKVPIELTGRMNTDHASYRRGLGKFVDLVSADYTKLAAINEPLAQAREAVLHRDIQNMTSHVELTYRLVGVAPALDENDSGSAVQELRSREMARTVNYSPMLRLGSRTSINVAIDVRIGNQPAGAH